MPNPPDNMEEKIVNAAIECLEKFGVQGTTNRKIAEIAEINSAAINYYFRSKDVLLKRAMERTLDNAFDWKDFEQLPGDTPQSRCEAIFLDLLRGGINYPGITRVHFYNLLNFGDYDSLVVERLNAFVSALCDDLQKHGYKGERSELEFSCIQIASAVFMLILAPKLYEKRFGLNYEDSSAQIHFVKQLIHKLL